MALDDTAFEPGLPPELGSAEPEAAHEPQLDGAELGTTAGAVLPQQAAEPEDVVESVLTDMTSATEAAYAEEQVTLFGLANDVVVGCKAVQSWKQHHMLGVLHIALEKSQMRQRHGLSRTSYCPQSTS